MTKLFKSIFSGIQKPHIPFSPNQIVAPARFFNRTEEAKHLNSLFDAEDGDFFVITGPPNCGKTALLSKVLSEADRRVVCLDLRLATWGSFSNLYSSLNSPQSYSLSGFNFEGNAQMDSTGLPELAAKASVGVVLQEAPVPHPSDFARLLGDLAKYIKADCNGKKPVLWIDEANYLKAYSKEGGCDKDSDDALQTLLTWGLAHSKQKSDFHVVMSSSESWFYNFLYLKGKVSQFSYPVAISDISKTEAQKYYEYLLSKHKDALPKGVDPTPFEKVYSVYGGRVPWIRRHVWKAVTNKAFPDPLACTSIKEAQQVLAGASIPTKFRTRRDSVAEYGAPAWTKQHLFAAMQLLVETNGCVDAETMFSKVPQEAVESMLDHNLFSFLPSTEGALHLPQNSGRVFIPTFPQHVIAMKELLLRK